MNVKFTCGNCKTETLVENVIDMTKLSCPCCGAKEKELKENDNSKKRIILKG